MRGIRVGLVVSTVPLSNALSVAASGLPNRLCRRSVSVVFPVAQPSVAWMVNNPPVQSGGVKTPLLLMAPAGESSSRETDQFTRWVTSVLPKVDLATAVKANVPPFWVTVAAGSEGAIVRPCAPGMQFGSAAPPPPPHWQAVIHPSSSGGSTRRMKILRPSIVSYAVR